MAKKRKTFQAEDITDLNTVGNAHDRRRQHEAKPSSHVRVSARKVKPGKFKGDHQQDVEASTPEGNGVK